MNAILAFTLLAVSGAAANNLRPPALWAWALGAASASIAFLIARL